MRIRRNLFASVSALLIGGFILGHPWAQTASRPDDELVLAYAKMRSGQHEAALPHFSAAIASRSLEPEVLSNALLNRALTFQFLKQHDDAIRDYTNAIKLDAMSSSLRATALYNRGLSYHLTANLTQAIEDYTAALFLQPEMAQAYLSRGNALRESGQFLFALSDYERAVRYGHPDKARVHYAAAMTYQALERHTDAVRELKAVLEANPGHKAAQERLAEVQRLSINSPQSADPMTTASLAPVGSTVVLKPEMAKAVEPTATLETAKATPAEGSSKIQDRLPEDVLSDGPETVVSEVERTAIPAAQSSEAGVEPAAAAVTGPAEQKIASAVVQMPEEAASKDALAAQPSEPAGWVVQIASASSESGARDTWTKMQKRHAVLNGLEPILVKADLGKKGVVYRVRLAGYDSQVDAKSACKNLKKNGVTCFVSKAGG